jgi:hypothetical protein
MPKIPTFKSQTTMTSASPNVESNLSINPSDNIYTATKSLTDYVANEYVKEAKLEADNKATLALNELFINQQDGTKGLYSIQAETKTNSKPLEAAAGFDDGVNKLWNYAKTNKLQNFNNFTQKALEKKFYATAGLFKSKALLGSREEQILETKKITNDVVLKESLALVLNGMEYLPAYKDKIEARLNEELSITEKGVLKEELKTALIFGEIQLGNSLATENPYQLKQDINKFTNLSLDQKSKLLANADATILSQNTTFFTSNMELTQDTTSKDVLEAYEGIINQTFNGDVDKIKRWQELSPSDKSSIITEAKKIRRANTSEISNRNTAILNEQKDDSINKYRDFFNDSKALETLDLLKINKVFGEPKNLYEQKAKSQIVELSTKIGEKEFSNVNNYYKNFNIQKAILSGQVTDHVTPFILDGETEAKSITQRVGDGVSKQEFGFYLNYLLPNIENKTFKEDHQKLYSRIEGLQTFIEGPSSLKYLDTTLDNRLNNFQSSMIFNFSEGLKKGYNADEMLDAKNKKFIGKEWQTFQPDKDYITKILSEKAAEAADTTDVLLPPPWNPDKYKTADDWLNSAEYKEYEIKKKAQ